MFKKIIIFTFSTLISFYSFANNKNDILPVFFEAVYDGYYKGDKVGEMKRIFKKDGDNYILISNSSIKGSYLFLPFSDKRIEQSTFFIDNNKYKPLHYRMDRSGTLPDFVMEATFDYNKDNVHMTYKDRVADKPIVGNVLDNALYQLRLQHDVKNGKNEVKYDIAYKTGFKGYHFVYDRKDTLNINNKKIELLKFKQIRKNKKGEKKGASSWLDPNNDYIMTQFIYYNEDGKEEAKFILKDYKQI